MLAGQVIAGGWLSMTATVKVQADAFPAASLVVQTTLVMPFRKTEPGGGLQLVVVPGQLSVTRGAG